MVSTRSSSAALQTPRAGSSASPPPPPTTLTKTRRSAATSSSTSWSHAPSTLTLLWLAVSLPLVTWDTTYVLLRPRSMPGGSLNWPIWSLYGLYGEVDHMYGFKQWNLGNGFTAAQGTLNAIETALYIAYVSIWWFGTAPAAGAKAKSGGARAGLAGRSGALAALLGFSAAVMTVSKTVLYWLNESFSGFDNIGHNDLLRLITLWIIPNGLWLVFPSIMIYSIGSEILAGLSRTSTRAAKSD